MTRNRRIDVIPGNGIGVEVPPEGVLVLDASIDTYPIEVRFPVISARAKGNTGIAYVHTLNSGTPGPQVMTNALTYGNEVRGAIVVDKLLCCGTRPRSSKLTLPFVKVHA